LRDVLLCLLAQSSQDFELVLVTHRAGDAGREDVLRAVNELPKGLSDRTRLLDVADGGRSRPVNVGLEAARGRYIATLDDDDLVLGHWVETFARAEQEAAGRVVRAGSVEQDVIPESWAGSPGLRVVSGPRSGFPAEFDLVQHLEHNRTPFMAYAFPMSLVAAGARVDERLPVCEDWDFALRAALSVGVHSVPDVTAVYRRWTSGPSSYSAHAEEEWRRTELEVIARLDAEAHTFPPGSIAAIRRARESVLDDLRALRARNSELEEHALRMERSTSWRFTAPLRAVMNWRRAPRL
jgi:glycosyltransferase involved in cell wall biosynthesis